MQADSYQFWSIVVAAVAVAITTVGMIWHGLQTRKHNRLSVIPKLIFYNIYASVGSEKFAGISISNNGLGPAMIEDVKVYIDGQCFPMSTDGEAKAILTQLGINEPWVSYGYFSKEEIMAKPGEPLGMFYIERDNQSEEKTMRLRDALRPMKIVVKYKSLYGERFTADST